MPYVAPEGPVKNGPQAVPAPTDALREVGAPKGLPAQPAVQFDPRTGEKFRVVNGVRQPA